MKNEDRDLSSEQAHVIDEILRGSTSALFSAYGLELEELRPPTSKEDEGEHMAGVIGFTSKEISGSLVISASAALVRRTVPEGSSSLHDWMGELANQLLGRSKNQLLKYGVTLSMSVPVVVTGLALQTPKIAHHAIRDYEFTSEVGSLHVRLDVAVDPALDFSQISGEDSPGIDEGELLLF